MGLLLVAKGLLRAFIVTEEGREITVYRLFERDICLFSASCMLHSVQFDIYVEAEEERCVYETEAVLCMDIDRLGRGTMSQQGVILETFKEAGVKIITPQKTYDLLDEMDEDYTELQTFFARKELKLIKKRMRRGVERTAADGGYLANAPYGLSLIHI